MMPVTIPAQNQRALTLAVQSIEEVVTSHSQAVQISGGLRVCGSLRHLKRAH